MPRESCSALESIASLASNPVIENPRAANLRVNAPLPQPASTPAPPVTPNAHSRSYKYCDHES